MAMSISRVEITERKTPGGMRYFDIVQIIRIGDRLIRHRGHEDWPRSRDEAMARAQADLPGVPVVMA